MQDVGLNFTFFGFRIGAEYILGADIKCLAESTQVGGEFGARINDGLHGLEG